jgi:hypothetical protein
MKFEGRYKYILIGAGCGAIAGALLVRSSNAATRLPDDASQEQSLAKGVKQREAEGCTSCFILTSDS